MDLDKLKDKALDTGSRILQGLGSFAKKTANSVLEKTKTEAGKAAGFAKEKTFIVLHKTGEKVRSRAAEQQETLLVLGFVFAAFAILAFVLRAYGRRK
ncbi:MAG: hypothetical protein IKR07_01365 [Oscillospiraceae bacterium]|nr:hypothetical protein [Oscillospiraceae bacterium]